MEQFCCTLMTSWIIYGKIIHTSLVMAISELPFASVSNQVQVQSLSYGN